MKKQELATVLRDRLELGSLKDANRVIDEFAKILSEAMVAGDEVTLPDVGISKQQCLQHVNVVILKQAMLSRFRKRRLFDSVLLENLKNQ